MKAETMTGERSASDVQAISDVLWTATGPISDEG